MSRGGGIPLSLTCWSSSCCSSSSSLVSCKSDAELSIVRACLSIKPCSEALALASGQKAQAPGSLTSLNSITHYPILISCERTNLQALCKFVDARSWSWFGSAMGYSSPSPPSALLLRKCVLVFATMEPEDMVGTLTQRVCLLPCKLLSTHADCHHMQLADRLTVLGLPYLTSTERC